ncbi:PH domain-containing protein [Bacteroides fragilis]
MHCDQFHNYTSNLDRYRMYRSQCNHLFSQTFCKYIVKKNGDLQIVNDFFRQKRTFSHITDVTYTRHALGMQKIKIRHATGFVMIDPQSPRELIKALQKTNPDVRVKNFI